MPNEEDKGVDIVTEETRQRVSRFTWPITIVVALLGIGVFFYVTMGRHDHTSQGRFVGPGKCKECHEKQYASWKKTRMANSFNVLRPGEKAQEKRTAGLDPDMDYTHYETCLPCHTTGYGLVGGFVSIEKTPDMAGVTCEACHGHGGTYVGTVMDPRNPTFKTSTAREAGLIYPPTETVCLGCHNARSPFVGMNYKFDFNKRVRLGTHEHYHLIYEHEK